MSNDVVQVSGFAKKKMLEAAGFEVKKLHMQGHAHSDMVWCVTDASDTSHAKPVIAYHRLQGTAVNEALEKLGGL